MGVIERKNCGKSVGLERSFLFISFSLILILSSVTVCTAFSPSHKLGHVEPLAKESGDANGGGRIHHSKGAVTAVTRRLTHPPPNTTGRDGLFGTKTMIHRNPSLFLNVPLKNVTARETVTFDHENANIMSTTTMTDDDEDDDHRHHHHLPDLHHQTITYDDNDGDNYHENANARPHSNSHTNAHINVNSKNDNNKIFRESISTSTVRSASMSSTRSTKKSSSSSGGNKTESDYYPSNNSTGNHNDFRSTSLMGGFLKREVWTIPLLSIAALNIFLITLFEIYVLCKARGPSRRHLFLGQMLLFGLFLCSSMALVFAITPSTIGCFLARLGLGVSYTLVFSVLMVKCVFLLSLDSGVYLPASYQACLLLFSVLVQVAIDTQWVIVQPPSLQINPGGSGPLFPQCGASYSQLLLTLAYNVFLILVVGALSFKTRSIRENYRESTYIGISILVTIPIWISWTVAGWILSGRHQDACVAFGLLAESLATFLIMFMPKGRQLAAMGKEGMYLEDQSSQCSGYSPSFFHFKPSKSYKTALIGDGNNLYTTLEPTISTINPNVFFHRSDFHPGMIY